MKFQFDPVDESTALRNKSSLLEEGYYQAEIVTAEAAISKAGNPMCNLQLKVWDNNCKERIIFTTLVNHPAMIYKILHLCKLTGLEDEYKKGSFDPKMLEGKTIDGVAHVVIRKGKEKKYPDTGFYPDKNDIEDFLPSDSVKVDRETGNNIPSNQEEEFEDSIPF